MNTRCRFNSCQWVGSVNEIFDHCERHHKKFIRELVDDKYYKFSFKDIHQDAFLLCGKNGIYWFALSPVKTIENEQIVIQRGVFQIGDSEEIKYTLKLGLLSQDEYSEYMGPYHSQMELIDHSSEEIYDIDFPEEYLELIDEQVKSKEMRLYIGENADEENDVFVPSGDDCEWTSEEDKAANQKCVEMFTCPVCFEYIRGGEIRCCENRHFICQICFKKMQKKNKLLCPLCRQPYPYDCHPERYERLLKMTKFPK